MSYPTSIEGGVVYTQEPVPGQRPVTQQYAVQWRTRDTSATVGFRMMSATSAPVWHRHPMTPSELAWFRTRVESLMRLYPPL